MTYLVDSLLVVIDRKIGSNAFRRSATISVGTDRQNTRAAAKDDAASPAHRTRSRVMIAGQRRQSMYRGTNVRVGSIIHIHDRNAREHLDTIADGWVTYGAIQNYRRSTVEAFITARMVSSGTGTSASVPISGMSAGVARGHLLARCLGGSGSDMRNLVPLAHQFTNLGQYQWIEKQVLYHVLRLRFDQSPRDAQNSLQQARARVNDEHYRHLLYRGFYHAVRYRVTPFYEESDVYPVGLRFVAECLTCGEWVAARTDIANVIE
jgi:hypothetical protein